VAANPPGHLPVLLEEVAAYLKVRPGETVVDATVGLAGHACRFAELLGADGVLVGLDVDAGQLEMARERLRDFPCRVELIHANFADLPEVLRRLGIDRVNVLFADLGVSSLQLDSAERGFSFQRDGPLDMRLDPSATVTAADLVNRLKDRDLADLLYHHAQETGARRIAQAICTARRERRITRTAELSAIVSRALGVDPASRKAKIHPATRTFLALRSAVNQETANLDALLRAAPSVLAPGGRFGVLAFHSVEDKPVKLDFRKRKSEGIYEILTKKPIVAKDSERRTNPRARSAKLRVVERLPTP